QARDLARPAPRIDAGVTVTCPDENRIGLLVDGELPDAERSIVEAHLDGCRACSRVLAELAVVSSARRLPARYRLIERLGAGSMGVIWQADDAELNRSVALKFIQPERIADPQYRGRLVREAHALARVRHPNVVGVYDLGRCGDDPDAEMFLSLELV